MWVTGGALTSGASGRACSTYVEFNLGNHLGSLESLSIIHGGWRSGRGFKAHFAA